MDVASNNTDVPACLGCTQRDGQIAQLESRIRQLEQQVEALSRSSKRQAAPFSKGVPKADPKKPGRKSGEDYGTVARRAIPAVIDEVYAAALPEQCPYCGNNAFLETSVQQQYQVEIPRRPIYRQFDVAIGQCTCCGKRVQGRHRLQTSDALGCCASQVGAEAQAAIVLMNKQLGLSFGKISRFFAEVFGIELSRGGGCQIMLRMAKRCEATYHAIVRRVQQSPAIIPDETGWRIGGMLAWLHVAVSEDAVAYLVAWQRGFAASAVLIGAEYEGVMTHDGFASYLGFDLAVHQTCLGHLIRRCQMMIELASSSAAAVFPAQVKALLQEALAVRDQRDAQQITAADAVVRAQQLQEQMQQRTAPSRVNPANQRLSNHLHKNLNSLFVFLHFEGIDATNHQAEQAIRPAVVNRKVWGGNRTEAGATAQSILMSVIFTAIKQGKDILSHLSDRLRSLPGKAPPLFNSTG
jgi:transposase